MSILIKGMEMPTSCYKCPVRRRDGMDIVCPVAHERFSVADVNILDYRLDNCPLVLVPPHGDLIDMRYAIATACSGRIRTLPTTEDGENWIRVEEVRESIKNAPTIIEAEEGE